MPKYLDKMNEERKSIEMNILKKLRANPDDAQANLSLAGVYLYNKKFAESHMICEKYLPQFASDPNYLSNLIFLKMLLRKYREAYAIFQILKALDPDRYVGNNLKHSGAEYELFKKLETAFSTGRIDDINCIDADKIWDDHWNSLCTPWKKIWGE